MALPSRLKPRLPESSIDTDESLGQQSPRFRKECEFTQVELAQRITRALISSYESEQLRPSSEMVVRFALDLSTDEVIGVRPSAPAPEVRVLCIEALQPPKRDHEALLRSIDAFLELRVGKQRAA